MYSRVKLNRYFYDMDYNEEWYEFTKEKLIHIFKFDNLHEVIKYLDNIKTKLKLSHEFAERERESIAILFHREIECAIK